MCRSCESGSIGERVLVLVGPLNFRNITASLTCSKAYRVLGVIPLCSNSYVLCDNYRFIGLLKYAVYEPAIECSVCICKLILGKCVLCCVCMCSLSHLTCSAACIKAYGVLSIVPLCCNYYVFRDNYCIIRLLKLAVYKPALKCSVCMGKLTRGKCVLCLIGPLFRVLFTVSTVGIKAYSIFGVIPLCSNSYVIGDNYRFIGLLELAIYEPALEGSVVIGEFVFGKSVLSLVCMCSLSHLTCSAACIKAYGVLGPFPYGSNLYIACDDYCLTGLHKLAVYRPICEGLVRVGEGVFGKSVGRTVSLMNCFHRASCSISIKGDRVFSISPLSNHRYVIRYDYLILGLLKIVVYKPTCELLVGGYSECVFGKSIFSSDHYNNFFCCTISIAESYGFAPKRVKVSVFCNLENFDSIAVNVGSPTCEYITVLKCIVCRKSKVACYGCKMNFYFAALVGMSGYDYKTANTCVCIAEGSYNSARLFTCGSNCSVVNAHFVAYTANSNSDAINITNNTACATCCRFTFNRSVVCTALNRNRAVLSVSEDTCYTRPSITTAGNISSVYTVGDNYSRRLITSHDTSCSVSVINIACVRTSVNCCFFVRTSNYTRRIDSSRNVAGISGAVYFNISHRPSYNTARIPVFA